MLPFNSPFIQTVARVGAEITSIVAPDGIVGAGGAVGTGFGIAVGGTTTAAGGITAAGGGVGFVVGAGSRVGRTVGLGVTVGTGFGVAVAGGAVGVGRGVGVGSVPIPGRPSKIPCCQRITPIPRTMSRRRAVWRLLLDSDRRSGFFFRTGDMPGTGP